MRAPPAMVRRRPEMVTARGVGAPRPGAPAPKWIAAGLGACNFTM